MIRDRISPSTAVLLLTALALAATPFEMARAAGASDRENALEIHGYGDIHYNNPEIDTMDKNAPARVDVHRLVLGWEYEFNPSVRFEGEVDFEHSATEIELEYAQIEYDLTPTMSLRAGSLLMPVGMLNEFHEPPSYHSVERPYVENYVIPTSWQEVGIGIAGRASQGALGYRAYVVSGLDAGGFGALKGLREGRQHGAEAKAEDLALVGRLEYAARGGVSFGASGYYGGADQGNLAIGNVTVSMATADLRVRRGALDLRGVAAGAWIGNSDSVSLYVGEPVGRQIWGTYGEAAVDLLHGRGNPYGDRHLWALGRYERFDTTGDTVDGVARDPEAERTVLTGGLAYHPVRDVSFKADFEHWEDGADRQLNRFNLGVGFQF